MMEFYLNSYMIEGSETIFTTWGYREEIPKCKALLVFIPNEARGDGVKLQKFLGIADAEGVSIEFDKGFE